MGLSFTKSNEANPNFGTSMIETFEGLRMSESDLIKVFGIANVDNSEIGSGYGDEWYFTASDGSVFGIGFRWGTMRTRGKAFGFNHEVYSEFLNWIKDELQIKL